MLTPKIAVDLGQVLIASSVTRSQVELTAPELQWLVSPDGIAELRAKLAQIDPASELGHDETRDKCDSASCRAHRVARKCKGENQ